VSAWAVGLLAGKTDGRRPARLRERASGRSLCGVVSQQPTPPTWPAVGRDVYSSRHLYGRLTVQTKLTLRLDDRLIRRAKAYAQKSGKSLSELVADLFARLQAPAPEAPVGLPEPKSPAVRTLVGALAGTDLDRDDYRAHLIEKHR
jgi:Family of unknown function (DUF6364)